MLWLTHRERWTLMTLTLTLLLGVSVCVARRHQERVTIRVEHAPVNSSAPLP